MHYIFITDSYYPSPSPNAICVEKLVNQSTKNGDTSEVIALRTFPKTAMQNASSYVRFVEPDWMYSLLTEAKFNNSNNLFRFLSFMFKLRGFVNGLFWPLMSLIHLYRYTRAVGQSLNMREKDVIVVGVYKSLETACAGALAKKIWGKGHYALYTLDAVAGSIIPTIYRSKKIAQASIRRWERFLFSTYDGLYLMKSHSVFYSSSCYDKFRSKMTFVDIPLLQLRDFCNYKKEDNTIHFVFTGGISKTTANPLYFIRLLEVLNSPNLKLDIYGKIIDKDLEGPILSSPFVDYHGPVSHDKVLSIQESADFLLNFGNFTPCAIPCKIFEYFSTKNPVISCIKIDEDASKDYVLRYPNSLIIDERLSIEENAQKVRDYIEHYKFTDIDVKSIFYQNTPEYTLNAFKKITTDS